MAVLGQKQVLREGEEESTNGRVESQPPMTIQTAGIKRVVAAHASANGGADVGERLFAAQAPLSAIRLYTNDA